MLAKSRIPYNYYLLALYNYYLFVVKIQVGKDIIFQTT